MKISLSLAILSAFAIMSCEEEPPVRKHRPAHYPSSTTQYPPQPQPFNPENQPPPPPDNVVAEQSPTPAATAAPVTKTTKGDIPYGIPVPNKPGFVTSPYAPNQGYVDVRGFPPGTEVKDPVHEQDFSCSVERKARRDVEALVPSACPVIQALGTNASTSADLFAKLGLPSAGQPGAISDADHRVI